MRKVLFFPFHSDRSLSRNLWCFFSLALSLLFSCLLFFTPPAHGAQTHDCAPDPPPPVSGKPITSGNIRINEILTNSNSKWNCSGPSNSWIELYNPQNQPFDLYAAHLIVSLDGGTTFSYLPFGTSIAGKGFLVIFPLEYKNIVAPPLWNVFLAINNNSIDQVSVPSLQADQSYARIPDGTGNWQVVDQPTIDTSNDISIQTSTPTTTLTPAQTPKPTRTPKGGGSNGGSTPTGSGTQPAWNQVQLPPGVTPTATAATLADAATPSSSRSQSPPVAQNGGSSGWQIALIITESRPCASPVIYSSGGCARHSFVDGEEGGAPREVALGGLDCTAEMC